MAENTNGKTKSEENGLSDFDLIEVIEYDFGSSTIYHDKNDFMLDLVTKRSLIKSVLGCCLAVFLFFGAYSSTFVLQSSLHMEGGLGTISLSVLYAVSLLSYPWLPSLTIRILGLKKTMATCVAFASLFVFANFYPTWTTILFSCAVAGVAMSTLWTCIPAYLTRSALLYCKVSDTKCSRNSKYIYNPQTLNSSHQKCTKERELNVISQVFSFFYFCFQCSMLLGHTSAYFILHPRGHRNMENKTMDNVSVSLFCGSNFCDSNGIEIEKPEEWRVFSLCGLYIASFILSFLAIIAFLQPLHYIDKELYSNQEVVQKNMVKQFLIFAKEEIYFSLKSTCHFMADFKLIPLAFITLYQGFEIAFVSGEFTKAFVSCTCGIDCVNYILICYSVTYIFGSLLWSWLIKVTNRGFVLFCGFILMFINTLLLLLWEPVVQDPPTMLFLMSATFGLADCALQPQVMALYSLTFGDKNADVFAAVGCADCLGGLFGFTISTIFCQKTKIYILMFILCFAIIGYLISEIRISKTKKQIKKTHTNQKFNYNS